MSATARPPRAVVIGFVVMAFAVSAWLMLHVNSSPAIRECRAAYEAAHTAADTALVDVRVPAHATTHREANTCGRFRRSARWS